MKKMRHLFIFISVVVVIGLGATAWIGTRVVPELQGYFARLARLNGLKEDAYRVERVTRSFFTSTVRVTLPPNRFLIEMPRTVDLSVEHGLLLWRGGFKFGLARIRTRIPIPSLQKDANTSKALAKIIARVGFGRQIHLTLHADHFALPANEIMVAQGIQKDTILWSDPSTVRSVFDPYSFAGTYRFQVSHIGLRDRLGKKLLQAGAVTVDGSVASISPDWLAGKVAATLGHVHGLAIGADSNGTGGLPDLSLKFMLQTIAETNATVGWHYRVHFAVLKGALPASAAPVQSGMVEMQMTGLARSGIASLIRVIRRAKKQQAQLTQTLRSSTNDSTQIAEALVTAQALQPTLQKQMILTLPKIFERDTTVLRMRTTLATRTHPNNTAEAILHYTGTLPVDDVDAIVMALAHPIPTLFALDGRVAFGTSFVQEVGGVHGARYATVLAAIAKQGWLKQKEDRYTMTIHYDPSQLILNGTSMPMVLMGLKFINPGGVF